MPIVEELLAVKGSKTGQTLWWSLVAQILVGWCIYR